MKKYKFIFCLSLLAIASCSPKPVPPPAPPKPAAGRPQYKLKSITADDLHKKLENKEDFTLVDVRDEAEYVEGHIDNAKLIPCTSLRERHNELDPKKEVVVYCHSGNRSQTAVGILIFYEFEKITEFSGGILEWEQKNYPVVKRLPQDAK